MYFYMCSTERTLQPVIDRTISCHAQECLTHWSEQLLCINPCACFMWIVQLRGCSVNWNPTAFTLCLVLARAKISDLTEKEMCSSSVQGHRAGLWPGPHTETCWEGKCLIWAAASDVSVAPKLPFTVDMDPEIPSSAGKPGMGPAPSCFTYNRHQLPVMMPHPWRSTGVVIWGEGFERISEAFPAVKLPRDSKRWKCNSLISHFRGLKST